MRFLGALLALFFLAGCGYKPAVHYTQKTLSKKVYVDMEMSLNELQNSVEIKDALNEAFLKRFGKALVKKEEAELTIKTKLKKVEFSPLAYDKYGYVSAYRAVTHLEFEYTEDGKTSKLATSGSYDFSIEQNSVISDDRRYSAIKEGSGEAIDKFISIISIKGAKE